MTEAPTDLLPPVLSMRCAGNLESFKVEEQVALYVALISPRSAAAVDFLRQVVLGLKLRVCVDVLTKLILDDLDIVFAVFLLETELDFELLEHFCDRFLPSEQHWLF
jgi:hypothetical protein